MQQIYLDTAATTPLDPVVLEAMLPYLSEIFGNPSSVHRHGQLARRALEQAREQLAFSLSAEPERIVFTSGATEAINHALRMVASQHPGGHIISSQLEHAATLATCRHLETLGHALTYLPPSATGEIESEAVRAALRPDTCLVALMLVNNETGIMTDIPSISQIAHEAGALVFCDAVQAYGFCTVDIRQLGVDMLTVSAHKAYGPKGVGALYFGPQLKPEPLLLGGEQERGWRAGTHNTAAVVGMAKAAELICERQATDERRMVGLKTSFEAKIGGLTGVRITGEKAARGPKHTHVQVADVDGEALLLSMDNLGVSVSAGSACAAGSLEPSHVLLAMGLSASEAKASLRFSLGRLTTEQELSEAVIRLEQALTQCRAVQLM